MKRKVNHPAPSQSELNGPKYWRSLDELAATPGFQEHLEREFPQGASTLEGVDRRQFFKLMAASFALGGIGLAAGCRRPEAYILPYGKSVEGIIPGLPLYFATAMPIRKVAVPLLAETHQGRPTKLEGNPTYTPFGGSTSLHAQAAVLDLYDPDRATSHTLKGAPATHGAIQDKLASIGSAYAGNGGAGLAFLSEEFSSPTLAALVGRLRAKFPQAIWAEYEPLHDELDSRTAQEVYGASIKPVYHFRNAKRIVAIDADFLKADAANLYHARDFANGRRVTSREDDMNRLYVAESRLTLTGSMADHRLRLATSHMFAFAAALAARIGGADTFGAAAEGIDANTQKWIDALAADLAEHRGQSLVIAGAHLPAAAHAAVHAINVALGNVGQTIDYVTVPQSNASTIVELASAIKAGSVKTLVVLGGNPVYNAPADLEWEKLQASVPDVVRYGYYVDGTTKKAHAHIAAAHFLESWGDARTVDGTIVPIQPMILPLFNGLTVLEVLARINGESTTDPYTLVYQTITGLTSGPADKAFRRFLHDGVLENSAYPKATVAIGASAYARLAGSVPKAETLSKDKLEVVFAADHKMDDGRFANNGWLQELPDPITKISWDNAILVSPRLARELGKAPTGAILQVARVEENEFEIGKEIAPIVEVTLNGHTVRGPLHIQPGLSNYTIVLPLGYGRQDTGRVGTNQGHNFYSLRTSQNPYYVTGAKLTYTSEVYKLANVQEHWSMEGRDIIREANLEGEGSYRENPAYVKGIGMESHSPAMLGLQGARLEGESDEDYARRIHAGTPRGNSLYENPNYKGIHQWGMNIDLNTCVGCNACVIACQAENNIPIVGKEQVLRGREMHWIRLDRYYSDGKADAAAFGGDGNREIPEDPQVSLQPMACVHCELAPCETVCPVNATVHDDEGINAMAYNRCIGTRYCANNCPYKVRRFNFFDFNKRQLDSLYMGPIGPGGTPELIKMQKNPNVTVRMRGVMEKCTYCIQRVQAAKIQQKVKARDSGDVKIPDGTIHTACQQVCPVNAIVFGDITDPNSAVSKAKARSQDYAVLGYLNTRPRTTYLGKLRNPNPKMPDYVGLPYSRTEYERKNHPGGHNAHTGEGAHGGEGAHDKPSTSEGESTSGSGKRSEEHGHTVLETLKKIGGLS
ncbi:MAG TPA: TAT-variant-translocated molybdopterin oxidoreductase [Opitutaceae bacterium]|nr:TAT-variant-translocated molybdopterin oxidoreductase [Opitutaceae bacterium]